MAAGPPPQTPAAVRRRATLAGTVVSVLLILAIVFGSRLLRDFDSALLPYAVATVFLAFGVAYRYTVWISAPGARRLFHKGWGSFFSVANFRTAPTALPKMIATYLGFQKFLGARSHARWAAHQLIFWGCLLAAAITFPSPGAGSPSPPPPARAPATRCGSGASRSSASTPSTSSAG